MNYKTEREHALGLCLGVIVNEKLLNLEKTTSSVLSVVLINLWVKILPRFVQKQLNDAGKEMEKKAVINLVDLAGRSVKLFLGDSS